MWKEGKNGKNPNKTKKQTSPHPKKKKKLSSFLLIHWWD